MSPAQLNVVALISGGKDSLYSILHCLHNGHRVVALANLYPRVSAQPGTHTSPDGSDNQSHRAEDHADDEEDINSFLYQTIGHSVVSLYGEALQLPLYRTEIRGGATQDGRSYDPSLTSPSKLDGTPVTEDETESLTSLLSEIKAMHPEANAVSCGAILSTYQRVRIESVATRLGLVPLSFLWMYPVLPPPEGNVRGDSLTGLLEDMEAAGCEARIIKISSGGLDQKILWQNLADLRTRNRLLNCMRPFFSDGDSLELRGAILGEGGEYETLALDGPKSVWRGGRIEVDRVDYGKGEGGVYWIRIPKSVARVVSRLAEDESKEVAKITDMSNDAFDLRTPALFDPQFILVLESLRSKKDQADVHHGQSTILESLPSKPVNVFSERLSSNICSLSTSSTSTSSVVPSTTSPILQMSNITYLSHPSHPSTSNASRLSGPSAIVQQPSSQNPDLITQATETLNHLHAALATLHLSFRSIIHTTLLLRHMSCFAQVNKIYAGFFPPGMSWPPARVCVAVGTKGLDRIFEPGVEVAISVLVDTRVLGAFDHGEIGAVEETRAREKYWKGLHVQSRSYWAPANIGPYSQAVGVTGTFGREVPMMDSGVSPSAQDRPNDPESGTGLGPVHSNAADESAGEENGDETEVDIELVYLAGQIPLVPSSMELHEQLSTGTPAVPTDKSSQFLEQATLSLQHLWRVAQERRVDLWAGSGVAYLPTPPEQNLSWDGPPHSATEVSDYKCSSSRARQIQTCWEIWRRANLFDPHYSKTGAIEDDEDETEDRHEPDPWDQQFNRSLRFNPRPSYTTGGTNISPKIVGAHRHVLPNHSLLGNVSQRTSLTTQHADRYIPPLIVAEVSELPRGAAVEWSGLGLNLNIAADTQWTMEVSTGRADFWVSIQEGSPVRESRTLVQTSWMGISKRTRRTRLERRGQRQQKRRGKEVVFLTVFIPLTSHPSPSPSSTSTQITLSEPSLHALIHKLIPPILSPPESPEKRNLKPHTVHGTAYISIPPQTSHSNSSSPSPSPSNRPDNTESSALPKSTSTSPPTPTQPKTALAVIPCQRVFGAMRRTLLRRADPGGGGKGGAEDSTSTRTTTTDSGPDWAERGADDDDDGSSEEGKEKEQEEEDEEAMQELALAMDVRVDVLW